MGRNLAPEERPLDRLSVSDASHRCDLQKRPVGRRYSKQVGTILPLSLPCLGR
jgi:hypothetical protein